MMERDELERKTVGTESRSRHCGENMSNGKKSENRGNIKAKKTKTYIRRGNAVGWKQNFGKMERRTIGRDETRRTGRRMRKKVYTRYCRKNMSRGNNNEDSAGRIEREKD